MSVDERKDAATTVSDLRRSMEGAMSPPAAQGDGLQVDVGGYQIFQGDATGPLIAELYVEVDPNDRTNTKVRIEHWGLYPTDGWVTPSDTNPTPRPWAFQRINGPRWANSGDFRAELRNKAGVIYIQARCETMAP